MSITTTDGQDHGQPDYNNFSPEQLQKESQRLKELSAELESRQHQLEVERKQEHDEYARTIVEALTAKALQECGATFTTNDRAEVISRLSAIAAVSLNDNGIGLRVRDRATGKLTTIDHAIERLITVYPELVDRKTLAPKLKGLVDRSEGKETKLYKSDFATAKEKSDYIARFGLQSWEDMPLQRPEFETALPANPALMNRDQWLQLSIAERARLATRMAELGLNVEATIAQIMRRRR